MKLDLYLIIGLTKESRHWSKDFLQALEVKLKPNSVQLIDLPGSGKFLHKPSPHKMEMIVNEARSQLTFNPKNKRVVIAISLGGMSAWSWVTQYPDDFTHLVMINSSLAKLSPMWKRVQPKAIFKFFGIAAASKGHKKEKKILDLCANNKTNAEKILNDWAKIGEEAGMSLQNTLRQIIAGMLFSPKVKPKLPLLVIAAKNDQLAHFSCSEAIANHSAAELVIVNDPSIGHAFHVDAPELLADTIGDWLQTLS